MRLIPILVALCGMLAPAPGGLEAREEAPSRSSVLPFIHDDFPRALAEARVRGVPIFIDVGAPW